MTDLLINSLIPKHSAENTRKVADFRPAVNQQLTAFKLNNSHYQLKI